MPASTNTAATMNNARRRLAGSFAAMPLSLSFALSFLSLLFFLTSESVALIRGVSGKVQRGRRAIAGCLFRQAGAITATQCLDQRDIGGQRLRLQAHIVVLFLQ